MFTESHPAITGNCHCAGLYNIRPNQIDITYVTGLLLRLDTEPKRLVAPWFLSVNRSLVRHLAPGRIVNPGTLSGKLWTSSHFPNNWNAGL